MAEPQDESKDADMRNTSGLPREPRRDQGHPEAGPSVKAGRPAAWPVLERILRRYEQMGLVTFPVGTDKIPRAEWLPSGRWKPVLNETSAQRLSRFHRVHASGEAFLVAVVLGDQYVVLDIDDEVGFSTGLRGREFSPEGPVVTTPSGGRQFWWRNNLHLTYRDLGWGEVRAGGVYCILPDSGCVAEYVKKGRQVSAPYRWAEDRPPLSEWTNELPEVPSVIRDIVEEHRESNSKRGAGPFHSTATPLVDVLAGVPHGQRNASLFKYACSLKSQGRPKEEAVVLVQNAAAACQPPYPSDPGEESPGKIVQRVYESYEGPDDRGPTAGRQLADEIAADPESAWDRVGELAVLDESGFGAFKTRLKGGKARYPLTMTALGRAVEARRGRTQQRQMPSAADVATRLLQEQFTHDGLPTLRHYHASFWLWNGTHYRELPDEEVDPRLTKFLQAHPETRARAGTRLDAEVKRNLAALTHVPDVVEQPCMIDGQRFEPASHLLSFRNGVVDLNRLLAQKKAGLTPHTPALFSAFSLPYDYDPAARCPRWKLFLSEVLPHQKILRLLQEWFGLCMIPEMSYQRLVFLLGEGANGKTVTATVLTNMLGAQNVSSLPLELLEDAHSVVAMRSKLLNISPEVGDIDRTSEGMLKAITGGEAITWNQKFKPVITERPTARLLVIGNTLPRFRDRSGGMWRRVIVVPFPVAIPEDRQDRALAERLCKELPGIVNWALEGLRRLQNRGRFDVPMICQKAVKEHRRECNPARNFLGSEYAEAPEYHIETDSLYSRYRDFCNQNRYMPLNESNFGQEVRRAFPRVERRRRRLPGGKRVWYYEGIRGPGTVAILSAARVRQIVSQQET